MSGRTLPTGFLAAATASVSRPVILVEIDWPGSTLFLWTGYGPLTWNGNTYQGTGSVGSVGPITETNDLSANGLTLAFSGIDPALVSLAELNNSQGLPGRVWLGELAADGTLLADPLKTFEGFIDAPTITDDGSNAVISVQLEKELIDGRATEARYTDQDQQRRYPGDLGMEFAAALQNQTIVWGAAAPAPAVAPGSFGGTNANYAPN